MEKVYLQAILSGVGNRFIQYSGYILWIDILKKRNLLIQNNLYGYPVGDGTPSQRTSIVTIWGDTGDSYILHFGSTAWGAGGGDPEVDTGIGFFFSLTSVPFDTDLATTASNIKDAIEFIQSEASRLGLRLDNKSARVFAERAAGDCEKAFGGTAGGFAGGA